MRYIFVFFVYFFFEQAIIAQDTLYTKSILGAGNLNISVSPPILYQSKIVFFTSNRLDTFTHPDFKMVVLDTCGNVEKIHTILLGYGKYGLDLGGYFRPYENAIVTKDGNILLVAYQHSDFSKDSPHSFVFKLDINGNVLAKEIIYTGGHGCFSHKIVETNDAFYLGGAASSFEIPPVPIGFFMKLDKNLKLKWLTKDFLATDITQVNDTIGIIGSRGMIKIFNNDTKAIKYGQDFNYFTHSIFVDGFNAVCFQDVYIKDSLNKTYAKVKMVNTDNNFNIKSEIILQPISKEQGVIGALYDTKDKTFLVNTVNYDDELKFNSAIALNKLDLNGNYIWFRSDTITHRNLPKSIGWVYDSYSGFILLPSKNIVAIIYTDMSIINSNYKYPTEIRFVKFDKNGKEILRQCNTIDTKENELQALKVDIFPNPATQEINIKIFDDSDESALYELSLFDNTGKLIKKIDEFKQPYSLSRDTLSSGIYFCIITNKKNRKTIIKKVIII